MFAPVADTTSDSHERKIEEDDDSPSSQRHEHRRKSRYGSTLPNLLANARENQWNCSQPVRRSNVLSTMFHEKDYSAGPDRHVEAIRKRRERFHKGSTILSMSSQGSCDTVDPSLEVSMSRDASPRGMANCGHVMSQLVIIDEKLNDVLSLVSERIDEKVQEVISRLSSSDRGLGDLCARRPQVLHTLGETNLSDVKKAEDCGQMSSTPQIGCTKTGISKHRALAVPKPQAHAPDEPDLPLHWDDNVNVDPIFTQATWQTDSSLDRHTTRTGSSSGFSFLFQSASTSLRHTQNQFWHEIWQLLENPESSRSASLFTKTLRIAIFVSVLFALLHAIFFQSSFQYDGNMSLANTMEVVFDGCFTLEICLRFGACPDRGKFFLGPANWVDLAAGPLSLFLRLVGQLHFLGSGNTYMLMEALQCVAPVLRLLKMLRHFEQFHLILNAFSIAFEALPVLIITLSIQVLLFSAAIFLLEPRENVSSFADAVWLVLVTVGTIGYGDMVPTTPAGKTVASVLIISSSLYMSIPLGIVGGSFNRVWEDRDRRLLVQRTRDRLFQWGYSPRDIPKLFYMYDCDGDGKLSLAEFRTMIVELKLGIGDERIVKLFRNFDIDKSGNIDDVEFMRLVFPKAFAQFYCSAVDEPIYPGLGQNQHHV